MNLFNWKVKNMKFLNERNKKIAFYVLQLAVVLLILYFILTKAILFFAPFLTALIITYIIEKPVRLMQKRFKFPRGVASAVSLFIFIILAGGLIGFLFYKVFMEVWELARSSSNFQQIILRLQEWADLGGSWYASLPAEVVNAIESNLEGIISKAANAVTQGINNLLNVMINILTSLPQALLYTVITLVGAFFISRDREKISRFVYSQIPNDWAYKVKSVKDDVLDAMIGYIKALLTLVTISFFEVLIGYTILGVRYSFFLAILTAIADLLPVLGPGTVLIPGSIFHLINGNYFLSAGFLILYILVTVVRQLLEPRIVGENIGIHPLVTLLFIYLGYRVFGIVGLILGPVFAVLLKSFQKSGILPPWKSA